MVNTPAEAVAVAKQYDHYSPSGMCQKFTRTCFGIGSYFGSAAAAWQGADKRHFESNPDKIPFGVPTYWLGGSRGFGHTAVSIGNGFGRGTDWPSSGRVGNFRISDIQRVWGHRLVGWAEDINNVDIPGIVVPGDNVLNINYANIRDAVKQHKALFRGKQLKAAVAKEVGKGHMNMASPVLGNGFREQYSALQKKYLSANGLRVTKTAADGIPGRDSLLWLAERQNFDLV